MHFGRPGQQSGIGAVKNTTQFSFVIVLTRLEMSRSERAKQSRASTTSTAMPECAASVNPGVACAEALSTPSCLSLVWRQHLGHIGTSARPAQRRAMTSSASPHKLPLLAGALHFSHGTIREPTGPMNRRRTAAESPPRQVN